MLNQSLPRPGEENGFCLVSLFASIVLTGTSIAPVFLVYAAVGALEGEFLPSVALALGGLFLVGLGLALLVFVLKHLERLPFTFSSVEVADRESLGLLVVYLLPLLRTSFSDLEYLVLVPAIAIFLALALTGHNYHFNPLLRLFRWNFYKVGTSEGVTYILITRRNLRSAVGNITVGQLTDYTLIDLER